MTWRRLLRLCRLYLHPLSLWSCWWVTGLRVHWCALAAALEWRVFVMAVNWVCAADDPDHCARVLRRGE